MERKSYRAALLVGLLGSIGLICFVRHLAAPPPIPLDETMEFFADEARYAKGGR